MRFIFAKSAFKQLQKLDRNIQRMVIKKLRFYLSYQNPLKFAESLKDSEFGNWRFRIGNYRVLFDVEDNKITILKIGHRKDTYK